MTRLQWTRLPRRMKKDLDVWKTDRRVAHLRPTPSRTRRMRRYLRYLESFR